TKTPACIQVEHAVDLVNPAIDAVVFIAQPEVKRKVGPHLEVVLRVTIPVRLTRAEHVGAAGYRTRVHSVGDKIRTAGVGDGGGIVGRIGDIHVSSPDLEAELQGMA